MSMQQKKRERFQVDFQVLSQWLFLKQHGLSLSAYFTDNYIKAIGIYGMGILGERLFDELKDSSVQIRYGIDRKAKEKGFNAFPLFDLTANRLPEADVIVVTLSHAYWDIAEDLKVLTPIPVLSLEDIVQYCYNKHVS